MKMIAQKTLIFLASIRHGILGIAVEILLTAVIMAVSFVVCLFWWGITQ